MNKAYQNLTAFWSVLLILCQFTCGNLETESFLNNDTIIVYGNTNPSGRIKQIEVIKITYEDEQQDQHDLDFDNQRDRMTVKKDSIRDRERQTTQMNENFRSDRIDDEIPKRRPTNINHSNGDNELNSRDMRRQNTQFNNIETREQNTRRPAFSTNDHSYFNNKQQNHMYIDENAVGREGINNHESNNRRPAGSTNDSGSFNSNFNQPQNLMIDENDVGRKRTNNMDYNNRRPVLSTNDPNSFRNTFYQQTNPMDIDENKAGRKVIYNVDYNDRRPALSINDPDSFNNNINQQQNHMNIDENTVGRKGINNDNSNDRRISNEDSRTREYLTTDTSDLPHRDEIIFPEKNQKPTSTTNPRDHSSQQNNEDSIRRTTKPSSINVGFVRENKRPLPNSFEINKNQDILYNDGVNNLASTNKLEKIQAPSSSKQQNRRLCETKYEEYMKIIYPEEEDDTTYNAYEDEFDGRLMATAGEYPHMTAVGFETELGVYDYKCGGSLISDMFVITAAHCANISGQSPAKARIGDLNLRINEKNVEPQTRDISRIHIHPQYNPNLHYNDIALLELSRPVTFSESVRPIRLWTRENTPFPTVFAMGYGSTAFGKPLTKILTYLNLTIVPNEECQRKLPPMPEAPQGIVSSQICAQDYLMKRDTCQGDSGGPLQYTLKAKRHQKREHYLLLGIISYGLYCRSNYPSVYTRISSYLDWIEDTVWK